MGTSSRLSRSAERARDRRDFTVPRSTLESAGDLLVVQLVVLAQHEDRAILGRAARPPRARWRGPSAEPRAGWRRWRRFVERMPCAACARSSSSASARGDGEDPGREPRRARGSNRGQRAKHPQERLLAPHLRRGRAAAEHARRAARTPRRSYACTSARQARCSPRCARASVDSSSSGFHRAWLRLASLTPLTRRCAERFPPPQYECIA